MRLTFLRLRLPVVVLIILILVSCATTYTIVYWSLTTHLVYDDTLRLESEYFRTDFPRNWLAAKWEYKNATSGNIYTALFAPATLRVAIFLRVFDEDATRTYLEENGFKGTTDMNPITIFEINRMYEWVLESSPSAVLTFEKNDTTEVSSCEANYTIISIVNGLILEDGYYNITGMFLSLSFSDQQRIFQAIFYGEESDWNQTYDEFMELLDSTRV